MKTRAPRTFAGLHGSPLALACTILAMLAATLPGCASKPNTTDDPLADMRSAACTPEERVAAVDRAWADAQSGKLAIHGVRDQFKTVLFLPSTSDDVRLRIVEKLLSDTTPEGVADTRNVLRLHLPREASWPIVTLISEESAKRDWTDMTPALVRSYARKVNDPKDEDRPERAALLKLHPGRSIEEIVYETFITQVIRPGATGMGKMLDERVRTDAWDLLGRLDKDGTRRAALLAADSRIGEADNTLPGKGKEKDTMLVDLRAAAKDLHAVPITGPELEWVRSLRIAGNSVNETWWTQTTKAIAGLSGEQVVGLEVRHAEAIRWASLAKPDWLTWSRGQLRAELDRRFKPRLTHLRSIEDGDYGDSLPETLEYWDAKLSWGDLLTILVIDEAIQDPGFAAVLLQQAEEDRQNTKTELGGAIEAASAGGEEGSTTSSSRSIPIFGARLYEPQVGSRGNDTKYIASERMIASTPRSLAHYHFHAQKERNDEYAGPSKGDIEYAANYGRNCLVFTSVGKGVLGVDYYQRNGARIDLGEIRIGRK